MHDIPEKIDSKFRYVLLAATRAEQLMLGAQPKLEKPEKHTTTAMEEILSELVEWDYGPRPEPVVAAPAEGAEEEAPSEAAEG